MRSSMRARIGRIIVAETRSGRPVTMEDLRVAGAMAVVMRDAIKITCICTFFS